MKGQTSLSDLMAYARKQIAAQRHPDAHHRFRPFSCDTCGVVPFQVALQHHTGSKKASFRGVIWGVCAECGTRKCLFRFTGEHRRPVREEKPTCKCGAQGFVVAEFERIEGDEGLPGFFDEGVVVGQCSQCGRNRVLAHTD